MGEMLLKIKNLKPGSEMPTIRSTRWMVLTLKFAAARYSRYWVNRAVANP